MSRPALQFRKVNVNVYVREDQLDRLRRFGHLRRVSVAQQVREALDLYLSGEARPPTRED